MEGEVGKRALECILMPAMFAAKNVRAQRDRLLQLRRRLQRSPGSVSVQELAADLFKVYSMGLKHGAGYLTGCLELAYDNDADLSFCNPAFAFVPEEQLYDTLFAQRLPARPTTQTDAFTRIEVAYYAVNLALGHHIPRCVEFLVGERPPSGTGKPDDCMVGYSDDTLAAATDHIFKTRLSDMALGSSDAGTERIPKTRPASSTVPWTRPKLPRPQLGSPLRWPAARTRTGRSATSTARAPSRASPSSTSTPPSPSSPPSSTPRRSPKPPRWPTKTHTSLRMGPIHRINQLTTSPDRGC